MLKDKSIKNNSNYNNFLINPEYKKMQIVASNTQNVGVGETDMCSKLSYYQLKIDCFKYVVCKPMVITKQKPVIDTQRWRERNQSIPLQKNHQVTKKAREGEKNKGITKQSETN